MLTVGSPLSSALAALNAMTPGQVEPAAATATPRHSGNALTGVSRLMLSPGASDALLRFSARTPETNGAPTLARASFGSANPPGASRDGIPADKLAWLDSLGADRWEVRQPPAIDEAAFQSQVLDNLRKNGSAKLDGFAQAHANGSLTIQRATDMPELGYKSFQVTLFKNDEAYGGVGFSVCNTEHWMAMRESGIYAGTGSVSGTDYVATWPMAWGTGDAEPGTYAAT